MRDYNQNQQDLQASRDRITKMLQAQTPTLGSDVGNISQSLLSALSQGTGAAGFQQGMANVDQVQQQKLQSQLKGEMGIHDLMQEQVNQGNKDAIAVDKAIKDITGSDTKAYEKIANNIHAMPEQVGEHNATMAVMKAANAVGYKGGINKEESLINLQNAQAKYYNNKASEPDGGNPSPVKEYNFYKKLSPQDQQTYLNVKRDMFKNGITYDSTGTAVPIAGVTDAKKDIKAAEAQGTAYGKEIGTSQATLKNLEASLPQLQDTVNQLHDLGQKATYTRGGQLFDSAVRQSGLPTRDAAVARDQYISLVANQILPLLRHTFGAQFTEREGNSLKATLGDPDKTPAEKDAVLKSFIDQKVQTMHTLQREVNTTPSPDKTGVIDYSNYFKD